MERPRSERDGHLRHPKLKEIQMSEYAKPTHTLPGGLIEEDDKAEDGVVNDSLGTISIADSTGTDDDKETGDAKDKNKNTRED
jgi:hypothetical protein